MADRITPLSCPEIAIHDDGDGLEIVIYPDAEAQSARRDLISKHKILDWDLETLDELIALATQVRNRASAPSL